MQEYKFDIINARFIASGVAVQAKGLAYRLRLNKDRDAMRQEGYKFVERGLSVRTNTNSGEQTINTREDTWQGNSDYWLGRTVLTDITIKIPGEGVLLINDAVINISLQKEIVKTSLIGRSGTIKEYVSNGDYQLNITIGVVATDNSGCIIDQYPEKAIEQLREIFEMESSLEVNSGFLDLFNINRIVITNFSMSQMTHSNRQVMEITALSDDEYNISSSNY